MSNERAKITIYEVAARANVAISTVSRVLNNSSDVSEKTRARVLRAVEELQYRPDRTARKLAQQRLSTLAVALPTYTTPFHNELLKGIRACLQERELDVDLLLCDLGWRTPVRSLLGFLQRGAVDGLLIAGMQMDETVARELASLRAPVVLIGSQWPSFDSYVWDDVAGSREAVQHLLGRGHRRIGMIRAFTQSEIQNERVLGYRLALEQAGVPFDAALVVHGDTIKHAGFSEEAGYEAMGRLLAIEPRITAVFASSDVQAIGAWKAAYDAGLRVPDDVAFVGYDDIKTSHYLGLSSVDQSIQQIGRSATERLLSSLGMPDGIPVHEQIVPKLRIRRSSDHSLPQPV